MTETDGEALAILEARCRSQGLLMTAPRRAILTALSTTDVPRDAVTLLQAARAHHAATSIGTVYRLLRELEHTGLAHAQAQPHARLRWRLTDVAHADADDPCLLQEQVHGFLRDLDAIGIAETSPLPSAPTVPAKSAAASGPPSTTFDLLQAIAEHLGYRLARSRAPRSL